MVFGLGCDVLANRLFVWLDHVRYVIITKRLMAYAGPSSNGRTLVFGTSYVGSNPAGPAIFLRTKPPSGGFLLHCRVQRIRTDEVKSRNRQKAYSALPCRGDPPIAKTKFACRLAFGECADSRIRSALRYGPQVRIFWCAIIAGYIISFERLVHG